MKNYKLSYYTIFTDSIDDQRNVLLFSSRSGRTVKMHKYFADRLLGGEFDLIPEKQQDILIKNMFLVPVEENELDTVIFENEDAVFNSKKVLHEVIQPSANCQLGCYYCGQDHKKSNLSDEIATKIVDRMVSKFESGGFEQISIGWFGGEPLMGLPQMRQINRQLRERLPNVPIVAKIVTNGLSLKESIFLELVKDFNVKFIEITLDGTGEYHDKHRYTKAGGKSFELIYKNLKRVLFRDDFKDHRCSINIRCNVDEKNFEGVEPLIDLLAKDGVHKKISTLYFAPIYSWGGNDAHKKSISREEMAMLSVKWRIRMIKLGYATTEHTPAPLPGRKKSVCLAVGGVGEMYDAYGNVFNCTEVSYTDHYNGTSYQLGNLKDNHLAQFEQKPLNDWNQIIHKTDQYPCHSCKIMPSCGGGCPKSWEEGMLTCPPYKYNLRSNLELGYLVKNTEPTQLQNKLDEFEASLSIADFQRMESHIPEVWI